jgi:CO dehydrogenase maturation factor
VKIGVVGKGGVGKTTVAALLADTFHRRGRRVIAIDTDSNPNLGLSLGLDLEQTEAVPVLPRAVIVGTGGEITADRLLAEYGRDTPSGTLLSAIRVTEAGAGCMCGGHATVRSLLGEVIDDASDVAVVDMEAGLEHLSRSGGTLAYADTLVVVVEPTRKSVLTAVRTRDLAEELGIARVVAIGNKARSDDDAAFLREALETRAIPVAGVLAFTSEVAGADRRGEPVTRAELGGLRDELERIAASVERAMVA